MVFANIEYLFLLLLLIPYIVWYILKRKKTEAALQISDARVYAHTPKSYKNYLLHAPFILRVIALALIIVVLARPHAGYRRVYQYAGGRLEAKQTGSC